MHSTRRSTLLVPTVMLAGVVSVLSAAPVAAQATGRQTVVGEGQRISATLSPGIRVGNQLWASGQLGTSPTDTTIVGQTTRSLENLEKVFKAAGTTLAAGATKCTVFLTDVKDFQGMNSAYTKFFPSNPPARSTVVVAALVVPGGKVEIECQGVIPQ
jgi:2-iminobutanoate/2-iminopropanoate deaminase